MMLEVMMEFVEANVDSIRVSLGNQAKVVLLRVKDDKFLPIWIGEFGAESINMILNNIKLPRPNTHDFIVNLMKTLGCKLKGVGITKLQNDTYYATVILDNDGTSYDIDCTPSDAIAIALRTNSRIFIAEELLENAVSADEAKMDDNQTEKGII
jgi:uncharacterized protein